MTLVGMEGKEEEAIEEEETINISITFLAKDSNAHDWGILISLHNEVTEQWDGGKGNITPEKGVNKKVCVHYI